MLLLNGGALRRTRPAKAGAYRFHCTQASEVSKPSGKTVLKCPHMDEPLRELRNIIREKSLRVGDFTLSSGKKSSYYLDCRMTTLDPRGALLIARLILERMRTHNIKADAIGGLTM